MRKSSTVILWKKKKKKQQRLAVVAVSSGAAVRTHGSRSSAHPEPGSAGGSGRTEPPPRREQRPGHRPRAAHPSAQRPAGPAATRASLTPESPLSSDVAQRRETPGSAHPPPPGAPRLVSPSLTHTSPRAFPALHSSAPPVPLPLIPETPSPAPFPPAQPSARRRVPRCRPGAVRRRSPR